MSSPAWRIAATSVAGPMHAACDEACQDRHRVSVTCDGALIAVVSDGAGSARYGGEGAELVCAAVAARLESFVGEMRGARCSRTALRGACRAVIAGIETARAQAAAAARIQGASLSAYHATLVGAALLPGQGGLFFHIGDGAALALRRDGGWRLSPPANGEYSNTTFFFTEADWRRHLRFSPVTPEYDTIFVMSDGVTDIALSQSGEGPVPFLPFFEPIARYLAKAGRETGEQALAATLDGEAVRARSGDDKTLVWAQAW